MALIDKETIRKEIERLKKENDGIKCKANGAYCVGYDDAFYDLLGFLDTLPEQPELKPMNIPSAGGGMSTTPPSYKLNVKPEQPESTIMTNEMLMGEIQPKKKSNALFDKCVENCDPAVMKEVSNNVDKILASGELDKEIFEAEKKYGDINEMGGYQILLFDDEFRDILRHFAEWGAENLKK